jgi:hypothetical protein
MTLDRTSLSIAVIAVFSIMLVGTSKVPVPTPEGGATAPSTSAVVPSTTGWQDATVPAAKVALKIPVGAKTPADRAGNDPSMGPYFSVVMPSGYGVYIKQARKSDPVAETKTFYKTRARGTIDSVIDAPDAVVVNRVEGAAGAYCEVTACSAVTAGKPMCVEMAGAVVSSTITKLTPDECLDVVAMVRSIKAAP